MSELGARLKTAREEKGISLDQLQSMTKIQKKYLIGIENGDYSKIPGKFYVRAFIKQYAEAVGLPANDLFEEYKNEIPAAYEEDISEQLSRVQSRSAVSTRSSKFTDLLPKILIGIGIVAALFLVWYIFVKNVDTNEPVDTGQNPSVDIEESNEIKVPDPEEKQKNQATEEHSETSQDEEQTDDQPESEEQSLTMEEVSGNVTTYQLTGTETFDLKIQAAPSGETWIRIVDGNQQVLFEGMLQDGASQSFDLSEGTGVIITAGNAADTEISVNDTRLEYELDPGQTVLQEIRIQFDKE
ncbi:helix-turn-helix domain-containing protein [Siminovitchia sediminis]|uniref:Helix-turn-helix domain-containing protein n=1 Tax=Siminovitchia sediminis TaxID=1274353 RepID=A0ABW4KQ70_9BACI